MKKSLFAVAFLFAMSGELTICRAANQPCDTIKIPTAVSSLLEKSYPQWRVEKASDLDADYQELWAKKFPENCPGFVAGNFRKADSTEYAMLLVPTDHMKKGYRLVVFLKAANDSWNPIILERDDRYTPTSVVIRLATPGDYEDSESNMKVHSKTDGIVSERIESGTLVYYWNGTRFRSVATSV